MTLAKPSYRGSYGGDTPRGRIGSQGGSNNGYAQQKKCYVCKRPGCWSTKHTIKERQRAYDSFRQHASYTTEEEVTPEYYGSFLAQVEGVKGVKALKGLQGSDPIGQFVSGAINNNTKAFVTEIGKINGPHTVSVLNDQAIHYAFIADDIFKIKDVILEAIAFITTHWYSLYEF